MAISNPSLAQIKQALTEMLPKLKPLSVPTGMISAFNNVPEGWLQCNGAAVSRTTYAALFAVIGTKYGSGDGSTTFNLPNLHHKFIEGTNTQSEVGQSVSAGLPNITGTFQPLAGKEPTMTWQLTVRFMLKREPITPPYDWCRVIRSYKVCFAPRKVIQPTKRRLRYNPRRCGCWPASRFDAVDETY